MPVVGCVRPLPWPFRVAAGVVRPIGGVRTPRLVVADVDDSPHSF